MASKTSLLGPAVRKMQPKLRMIANGNQQVNTLRSDVCSCIRVIKKVKLTDEFTMAQALQVAKPRKKKKKTKLRAVTGKIEASVFIQKVRPELDQAEDTRALRISSKKPVRTVSGDNETINRRNLSTASVPLDKLRDIAEDENVAYIELGEPLTTPTPVVSPNKGDEPSKILRSIGSGGCHKVLIGIIDVQGFDFAHEDFLEPGGTGTRFERIWDQGGNGRPSPSRFNYGSEILKKHMDKAIAKSSQIGLAPQLLEKQSQMVEGSHGTHVASIAAGNRGICRNTFIAGVLISLSEEDFERRRSFYDSTRIAHAVEYLLDVAEDLRQKHKLEKMPVSINISLGTNGHAHDGSSAVSRWLDSVLATPGRSICVAAGNAGQEKAETEEDYGYVMGRIHTSGQIAAQGLENDIEWIVVGNGIHDLSENELEIWYSPSDRFAISIQPPDEEWIGPVKPGQYIENKQLSDGSFLSAYNELYHPANGANYIAVYLSPFFGTDMPAGVRPGVWKIRLHGIEVRDGNYHGWIERDDPRRLGRIGSRNFWRFPSFFSERSNVDNSSVSSLACGPRIISVANLDEEGQKINISSSQGPTRDKRPKPDLAANGTDIVAAKGFHFGNGSPWITMSGTSMASPYVAGVVGLMLATNPKLTAAQIGGILQRTSRPLPGIDYKWQNDAGYGVIDPEACLSEVKSIHDREDIT